MATRTARKPRRVRKTGQVGHRRIDLIGKRFGRWLVTGVAHHNASKQLHWVCRCDCGTVKDVNGSTLRLGRSTSCGCRSSEMTTKRNTIHSKSKTPTYRVWAAMLARCYNPNVQAYKYYGGRGIAVCDLWRHSFEDFYRDMGDRPNGRSLDRIDPDGPYAPLNCRWATPELQANNKSRKIILSLHGRSQTVTGWAAELGIPAQVLYGRIYAGHSDESVLTKPYVPGQRRRRDIKKEAG